MPDPEIPDCIARLYLFVRQVRLALQRNAKEELKKSARDGCSFAEEDIAMIHKTYLTLRRDKDA